ncbi:MAG: rhodoquinone biosynthesis methyltransferase RquA [Lactobacillaceae bacterium]|jgi:phospholipid N-methyltransferase|nr:rhodoquinone biosynthesis methyltransferase RquA [Lactobacillaceae bacterium]
MTNEQVEVTPTLPPYIKYIYRVYENKKLSRFFDSDFKLGLISFGYRKKLIQAVLREVEQSKTVLQVGATFGSQIDNVASKVGYYGNYHLVDVSKTQLDRCKKKYKGVNQNMNFSNQNGLAKINHKYDCAISFLLLHELPHKTRKAMVENLLDTVKDGGKVVFIDYHKPEKAGILAYLFKKFNQLYRPFVEEFWEEEIQKISAKQTNFTWHKSTMFGGFYQKVVAIKKEKKS